jgi:hypothetical protein
MLPDYRQPKLGVTGNTVMTSLSLNSSISNRAPRKRPSMFLTGNRLPANNPECSFSISPLTTASIRCGNEPWPSKLAFENE